jgi:large subunit ribosomal protein L4
LDGQIVREEQLDPYVFGAPVHPALLHQVVTAQLVNRRQGNANTRTRSEVSGGNRKPYRQKGTGRARQGSTRAPQWRGGGTVFGPQPHAYERAIPRKMRRIAIRSALSDKAANGRILLMDSVNFEEPNTKDMEALLANLPLERHILLLMPERDENVVRSARNIHRIKLGHVSSINVVELLKYDHLLMPLASVVRIVRMFGQEADDALQMKRHPRVVERRRARRARTNGQATVPAVETAAPAPTRTAKTATSAKPAAATATEPPAAAPKRPTRAAATSVAPATPPAEPAQPAQPAQPARTAQSARTAQTPEATEATKATEATETEGSSGTPSSTRKTSRGQEA